jgi:hypothetical protein
MQEMASQFRRQVNTKALSGGRKLGFQETVIRLYAALPGETATLYEMGIPVVETADKWPGFLRQVRVAVFNRCKTTLRGTTPRWRPPSRTRAANNPGKSLLCRFGGRYLARNEPDAKAILAEPRSVERANSCQFSVSVPIK